jgi:hypothetical protein
MSEWERKYADLAHIIKARDEEIAALKLAQRLHRILLAWQLGRSDGHQAPAAAAMSGDALLGYLLREIKAGEAITAPYWTPLTTEERPPRDLLDVDGSRSGRTA